MPGVDNSSLQRIELWNSSEVLQHVPRRAVGGKLETCHLMEPGGADASNASLRTRCNRWVFDDTYYSSSRAIEVGGAGGASCPLADGIHACLPWCDLPRSQCAASAQPTSTVGACRITGAFQEPPSRPHPVRRPSLGRAACVARPSPGASGCLGLGTWMT